MRRVRVLLAEDDPPRRDAPGCRRVQEVADRVVLDPMPDEKRFELPPARLKGSQSRTGSAFNEYHRVALSNQIGGDRVWTSLKI